MGGGGGGGIGSAFDFQGSCPARARGCGYWGEGVPVGVGGVFTGFEDVLGVFLFLLFSSYVCVFSVAHVTML